MTSLYRAGELEAGLRENEVSIRMASGRDPVIHVVVSDDQTGQGGNRST